MRELVVISGKGGTGKTSVAAALATLLADVVVADCDVDAADLHLLLDPEIKTAAPFVAGFQAIIEPDACSACGVCAGVCRFDAIAAATDQRLGPYAIDPLACEGCGVCAEVCPEGAIAMQERTCGEWYHSETRCGPLVHARLSVGGENSGRLVTLVRKEARRIAAEQGRDLILVDGPPGTGCPVIAAITGATAVLVVTEPTVSGEHDLQRVLDVAAHFRVPAALCINKCDLNPEMADRILTLAARRGAPLLAELPYDDSVTAAQLAGRTLTEWTDTPIAGQVRELGRRCLELLESKAAATASAETEAPAAG